MARAAVDVWQGMPFRERGQLFERIISSGFWRELPKRGNILQPCIPVVKSDRRLQDVFPQWQPCSAPLPEVMDFAHARTLVLQEDRACNDAIFAQFFDLMVKSPDGDAQRSAGRLSKRLEAASREWQDRSDKMRHHVQTMNSLRDAVRVWDRDRAATSSPSQRDSTVSVTTEYEQKHANFGRCYARGVAFQNLSRRLRSSLAGVPLQDWDMENSMVVLTVQLVAMLGIDAVSPSAALTAWKRYAGDPSGTRQMLARSFGAAAKEVALKVANGGAVPDCADPEALVVLELELELVLE